MSANAQAWDCGTPRSQSNAFNWQEAPVTTTKRSKKKQKTAIRPSTNAGRVQYDLLSKEERTALRKQIAAERTASVLTVNKYTDLGAHGGLSKGQKASR